MTSLCPMLGFCALCWLATSLLQADPVLRVVRSGSAGTNLVRNPGFESGTVQIASWGASPNGFRSATGEGRGGTRALACVATNTAGWYGASQTLTLNRTNLAPLVVRGWSRAEEVGGSADSDYALYVDILYRDGTPLWGQIGSFSVGTHDWEEREFTILPAKPVRSFTIYCLFRGHTGRVWFDDVSVSESVAPVGAVLFQGTPMTIEPPLSWPDGPVEVHNTGDGLRLTLVDGRVRSLTVDGRELAGSASSGFLARDVAADSDLFSFTHGECSELGLRLDSTVSASQGGLTIEGRLTDTTGNDRAVMLVFALPVAATGWRWGDDVRRSRAIAAPEEFSNTVGVNCGVNGQQSRYPLAAVDDGGAGLALGIDMGVPAQYRLAGHGGTGQLLLAYDFGLVKDTARFVSSAEFRFVLYRFAPAWGFRAAFDKYTALFPAFYTVRTREQGIWMPFTDVATVENWRDFGFRYHEGNGNVLFDDRAAILSFRYTEPMTWWMPMAQDMPRTLGSALATRDAYASGPAGVNQRMAAISRSAAMFDAAGEPALLFRDEPWASGAVWSLNPNPRLPAQPNAATVYWNDTINETLYGPKAAGVLDGEYLDSLEGYVTADLNFRREHFAATTVPLSFSTAESRPALWKGLAIYEFTRWIAEDAHRLGKLSFANGVPYRFGFLCPWLDVLGTETDWLVDGQYSPSSHEQMCLWRTLAGRKPYLLLMNTDFDRFGPERVERYFQRSLFYGMYPSMFSHNAADNPYWETPRWYNRDRALFRRYQPAIREVAEAGWQPLTWAVSDETNVLVERFGPDDQGALFYTLFNDGTTARTATIRPSADAAAGLAGRVAVDLLTGARVAWGGAGWRVTLAPQAATALKLQPLARFLGGAYRTPEAFTLEVDAPVGSTQVLEVSENLMAWRSVDTNTVTARPYSWRTPVGPPSAPQYFRLRWAD